MDTLPTIMLEVRNIDPEWRPIFEDGHNRAINADSMYITKVVEVEVLQLNLSSGGMRVRYQWPDRHSKKGFSVETVDVPIGEFFNQYSIQPVK